MSVFSTAVMPPEYEYDIFVSYSRRFVRGWVPTWFRPELIDAIADGLQRDPKVFVDTNMEAGADLPAEVAHALASSRILMPLFSQSYPSSRWCTAEFAHMWRREEQLGLRTAQRPKGLIVPGMLVGEERHVAPLLRRLPVTKGERLLVNVFLHEFTAITHAQSPTLENLRRRMQAWGLTIVDAINRAPRVPDPSWLTLAYRDLADTLYSAQVEQMSVPSLGQPSRGAPVTAQLSSLPQ